MFVRALTIVSALSLAACSGNQGHATDAGTGVEAADASALLDAGTPRCIVDASGSSDPAAAPAFGYFQGENAIGSACLGGSYAVVRTLDATDLSPSQTVLVISTSDFGDPSTFFQFDSPAGAASGSVAIFVGLPAAVVGTFSSAGACGALELCAIMPTPSSIDCGDAAAPSSCPAGCDFVEPGGPCGIVTPERCFYGAGVSDCAGTPTAPIGSWELVLDSIAPFADDASTGIELTAHGVFRATLASDADAGSTTITIGF